ncbi:hypothetical protein BD626DRAFT_570850 [Schizophyllum amplum]|uniref:Uncharacterized protein n=1 Tax=Schizophyllum amplum TaxID=97359 RepID=A0A550CA20_9AGAR|nr:hypothetical protein BD626DRAFT_570850 [Auriculariopsis ampla]
MQRQSKLLPPTCDDAILSCLNPRDITQYGLASRETHRRVKSYYRRAFYLPRALESFFDNDHDIEEFRDIQRQTGLVISGSFALRFMGRLSFKPGDLDVYVKHTLAGVAGEFLTRAGYEYRPRRGQPSDFNDALALYQTTTEDRNESGHYAAAAIVGAYNFVNTKDDNVIVQIITARTSPVDAILGFHSTAVMNMITHSSAISLYPRETFLNKRSLRIARNSTRPSAQAALVKYSQRGFDIVEELDVTEASDCEQEFGASYRYIGDDFTWEISLCRDRHWVDRTQPVMWQSWRLLFKRTAGDDGEPHATDAIIRRRYLKAHPLDESQPDQVAYTFADTAMRDEFKTLVRFCGTNPIWWVSRDSNAVAEEICKTMPIAKLLKPAYKSTAFVRVFQIYSVDPPRGIPDMPKVTDLSWIAPTKDIRRLCSADIALVLMKFPNLQKARLYVDVGYTFTLHQGLRAIAPSVTSLRVGFPHAPPMDIIAADSANLPNLEELIVREGQPFDVGSFIADTIGTRAKKLKRLQLPAFCDWNQLCDALDTVAPTVEQLTLPKFNWLKMGSSDALPRNALPVLERFSINMSQDHRNDLSEIWTRVADLVLNFLAGRHTPALRVIRITIHAATAVRAYKYGSYAWKIFRELRGIDHSLQWQEWIARTLPDNVLLEVSVGTRYAQYPKDADALALALMSASYVVDESRFRIGPDI